jgi:hypothetical protein
LSAAINIEIEATDHEWAAVSPKKEGAP